MTRALLAMLLLLIPTAAGLDSLPSGPETGQKVEPLRVFATSGDHAGQALDIVADRAARPTVYLFVQAERWDRPMARFLRSLDQALRAPEARATLVAVWLTDDVEAARTYQPRAQQSLNLERTTWSVFEGPRQGPAGWSINDAADLTAVVVRDGRVLGSFGFRGPADTDLRAVLAPLTAP